MFKKTKGFILGVVVTLLLTMAGTVLASTVRNINFTFRDIRLVVNGQQVTPRDAQDNVVEPFIFEGTTFLPVRAVAEALGQDVNWDGATNTVYIGGTPAQPTEPPPPAPVTREVPLFDRPFLEVGTAGEFTASGTENEDNIWLRRSRIQGIGFHRPIYSFQNFVVYTLNNAATNFRATPHPHPSADMTVLHRVFGDGQLLYTSPLLLSHVSPVPIDVNVLGCNENDNRNGNDK